jgi:branched-chain amino acid transport system permease protein
MQQAFLPYYLILVILFISSIIIYKIANSKTGLVFISILDDEVASKACGINVTRYKLLSFVISGLFGTLAGALQAHFIKLVNPAWFALDLSFGVIIVTFLGGIGTIYGPILGAYVYFILDKYVLATIIPEIFAFFSVPFGIIQTLQRTRLLIFTVIVLILIIKWPRGVARGVTDKLEDLEEARDIDERGPRIWKRYRKKETE